MAQSVKSLPAMWETQVRSLGQEDPLEKEMANSLQYSSLENPIRNSLTSSLYVLIISLNLKSSESAANIKGGS